MNAAPALILTSAAALLLVASRRTSSGAVEAASGDLLGAFAPGAIADGAETVFNRLTEGRANVDNNIAERNVSAFLKVIRQAEGTEGRGGYRAVYGYGHLIQSFADHPAVTGEWTGVVLPDGMCKNAGFGPGCRSTAAGAYQIIKPTWTRLKRDISLSDFGPSSQDRAATELVRQRGALEDVRAGRFATAINKCRQEWASLPGNSAKQGQRSIETLAAWYASAGGTAA